MQADHFKHIYLNLFDDLHTLHKGRNASFNNKCQRTCLFWHQQVIIRYAYYRLIYAKLDSTKCFEDTSTFNSQECVNKQWTEYSATKAAINHGPSNNFRTRTEYSPIFWYAFSYTTVNLITLIQVLLFRNHLHLCAWLSKSASVIIFIIHISHTFMLLNFCKEHGGNFTMFLCLQGM